MKKILFLSLMAGLLISCNYQPENNEAQSVETDTVYTKQLPNWAHDASIYEVNIRQYTPEGTIKAFTQHLDRLQKLGVEILWIMPVQPIGVEKRKGELGSYYSISDYTAVNPNFGTVADFKNMVQEAHKRGMKVILDWVANHTAFDHHWTEEHPDWYTRDSLGNIVSPVEDWSDVADLNYDAEGMQEAMQEEMLWWVNECDIDGFRCDVAMMVPMAFWNDTRARLDSVKPVFMLAEAEGPEFHNQAFDMTYGWEFHHIMNEVAKGEKTVSAFEEYRAKIDSLYQPEDIHMYFTTNHDENSWNGTVFERMGANHKNFFVLAATFKSGMPLIYSGQEAGLKHRLSFFGKDSIDWSNQELKDFYEKVIALKSQHPALANGEAEGSFEELLRLDANEIYAYKRVKGDEELWVFLNFSENTFDFKSEDIDQTFKDVISGKEVKLSPTSKLKVEANSFRLLTTK